MSTPPKPGGGRRATTLTAIVGVIVAVIYLFNTNLLGGLVPGLVDSGEPATATVVPAPAPVGEAATVQPQAPSATAPPASADAAAADDTAAAADDAAAATDAPLAEDIPVGDDTSADSVSEAEASAPTPPAPTLPTPTLPARINGVPTIADADLPTEAHATIALIEAGGPYPYDKDGSVFQNREGILPGRPRGYYREYTVETPGSDDRGARRIVEGAEGELYYTDDHYESFYYVVRLEQP